MAAPTKSAIVNKFTIWGAIALVLGIAATVLGAVIGDVEVVTMIAIPLHVLSVAMFFRNHLDHRIAK